MLQAEFKPGTTKSERPQTLAATGTGQLFVSSHSVLRVATGTRAFVEFVSLASSAWVKT